MKPDQERVKNLLLDTVTLLCKNSLQFENQLRVEGLLGVAVDDQDVFFLHISENFKSAAYLEKLEAEAAAEAAAAEAAKVSQKNESASDKARCSPRLSPTSEEGQEQHELHNKPTNSAKVKHESNSKHQEDALTIKSETVESLSEEEDVMITGSSSLNSPENVAQSAMMVAGKRRAERRPRTRSPLKSCNSSIDHSQTSEIGESDYANNSYSHHEDGAMSRGQTFEHYKYDAGDSFKQESDWGEPPAKRHANSGTTHPWPNVAGFGDLAAQAVQASFQESEDSQVSGGGDISQPGCSTWSSQLQASSLGATNSSGQETEAMPWVQPDDRWPDAGNNPTYSLRGSRTSVEMMHKTGELYSCNVCKAAFAKPGTLEKHMAKHTGEKRWICSVCYTAFARKDYLTSHMMVHTGEKPYKCHLCPAAYRQKGKLNKHMSSVHPDEKIVSPLKTIAGSVSGEIMSRKLEHSLGI